MPAVYVEHSLWARAFVQCEGNECGRPERQWPLTSELYAELQKILSWTQYSYAVSLQCG